jgi:hypothetical protein
MQPIDALDEVSVNHRSGETIGDHVDRDGPILHRLGERSGCEGLNLTCF